MRVIILPALALMIVAPYTSAVTLEMDPNAMPDGDGGFWRGTVEYASGGVVASEVDFAVYLPKSYGGLYYGGSVPVPDDHYVYAYQIHNVAQEGGSALTTFTVGLEENSGADNNKIDFDYGEPGGIVPSGHLILLNSFQVTFVQPQLVISGHSVVVLFTSPYGPVFTDTSVIESGESWQSYGAPAPVPEPTSLSLLLALTSLAALQRCRNQRVISSKQKCVK